MSKKNSPRTRVEKSANRLLIEKLFGKYVPQREMTKKQLKEYYSNLKYVYNI